MHLPSLFLDTTVPECLETELICKAILHEMK